MNPEHRKSTQGGARLEKKEPANRRPGRKKRPRPQLTRKQKILRIVFIVLTVIAAVIVVGTAAFFIVATPPEVTPKPQTTTIIDENGNEVQVEIPGLAANRKKQFYTFLIVGQDTGGGGNTDTLMLAAYDVPNQTLNVMSIPRDTYVNYGGKVLINSVYNRAGGGEDGIEALKKEVGELTGVTPDFYVIIQWDAVGELVDAIDGVYFDVPRDMNYDDPTQDLHIHLSEGYQLLNGEQAMGVVRYRHDNSTWVNGKYVTPGYPDADLGRIKTQQAFLTAVIEKCLQPTVLLPNLMEYVTIFQKNVETDLSIANLAYFGKSAAGGLDMSQVEFVTLPNKSAGNGHLLPIGDEIVELINESFNPYDEEITLKDLDLVTSYGSSSSSGGSSSTAKPSTQPSDTPAPETSETPETSPAASESPAASASAQPSSSPAASTGPETTPTPAPTPAATPAPTATPAPVSTPASTEEIEYGPGMEPVA